MAAHRSLICAFLPAAMIVSIGLAASADTGGSAPAAPLKVLRQLRFAVSYGESSQTDTKVAGFDHQGTGHSSDSNGSSASDGTIAVDVMGATGDGGLVVDVSEDAQSRRAAPVRVGVIAETLLYDPKLEVTEEERTLLHFLARDFIKATDLSVGTTWIDDSPGTGGVTNHLSYKVRSVDVDAKTIAVDFEGTTSMGGPSGFQTTTHGTMTYDTALLVPLQFTIWKRTFVQNPDRLTTIDSKMSANLRTDSFRKTPVPATPALPAKT